MALRVYNTLTQTKEDFKPIQPGKVGIYLCGPTVYKPSHIGHAVGPIIFDAIKRYLVYKGYQVTWVVNITDIDDKIIVEADEQKITVQELAERVTRNYLDALDALAVRSIDKFPKASEHVGDIIDIISRLVEKGYAYESEGTVYFDVAQDEDYGKLSHRLSEEQAGARQIISGQKRNPGDFALWKAAKPEEPDAVKYDSPWGKGRPGWHIECSAMGLRLLGETFDMHGGGMDLIFPHHENEIAQSECATGKPFVKYWMHHGLTRFNTKKVSKSDPEMQAALERMTLHNLLREYPPELIRYFVLSTHYRRPIEYSTEEIESKRKGLNTFYRLLERVERISGQDPYSPGRTFEELTFDADAFPDAAALKTRMAELRARYMEGMDDDFNTAAAIATLFDTAGVINKYIEDQDLEGSTEPGAATTSQRVAAAMAATRSMLELARILGLFEHKPTAAKQDDSLVGPLVELLIDIRARSKKEKNFAMADHIRQQLGELGVTLEDRPGGTTWRKTD